MSTQGALDFTGVTLRPLARNADDPGSHAAATALVATGAHRSQLEAVLWAVTTIAAEHTPLTNGVTSQEVATHAGLERHLVARRLPDLLELGYVAKAGARICTASARLATPWRVTPLGLRALRLGLPIVKVRVARMREEA